MSDSVTKYEFGIDFSSIKAIPEDPRDRLEYFNVFKGLLESEREKIKAFHASETGGREVVQANTCLVDEALKQVINSLAVLPEYSKSNILQKFALAAVGGYGRGELNPHSDVDLLFILPKKSESKLVGQFIQDVVSVLWGIKLEIGHSCRTIRECQQLAREDLTVGTSMIDTRFLLGDQDLYKQLCSSVRKNILNKNMADILKASLKEKYEKYGNEGVVVNEPEPDIKNGPGGLRDYHAVLWAAAVKFGCFSLHEISRSDIISHEELNLLDEGVDFLLRVRNELHYLTGKKTEILTFDIQKQLAENLGYRGFEGNSPVEMFMRDYFIQATNIHSICETVFIKCMQAKPYIKKVLRSIQEKDIGQGLYVLKNRLTTHENKELPFNENKGLFLHIFRTCKNSFLEPNTHLKREIRLNSHLIDDEFIQGEEVKEFLFELLEAEDSERILRLMHETSTLGNILPEFGQSHCLVTYDFYHRFTADEHSLRMVRFLEELADLNNNKELADLTQVFAEVPSKLILKLACLLHTLGKEQQSSSENFSEPLKDVSKRLKLDDEQLESLDFILKNLDTMNEFALHQDINQPATIEDFANRIGTPKQLNLLYLISYAELKAVAPDTWTASKNVLLAELYQRTRNHLLRPETIKEKPQNTRDAILELTQDKYPENVINNHLDDMSEEYLGSVRPEEAVQHYQFSLQLSERPFVLHPEYRSAGRFYDLILCRQNDPNLFKNFVGAVTAMSLNILGAQIYSRKDDLVFMTLQIDETDALKVMDENKDVWKEVEINLKDVLDGTQKLSDMLSQRTQFIVSKKNKSEAIIPKVEVINTSQSPYTFIRVEARDHQGMLYKIAKPLADLDIQIHKAKIDCQGGRGIDVFYTTLRGEKIRLLPLIRRIKEKLINILLVEKLEDI
ncbi:MAG: [protein-PII] uridylyltransferase [Nitrospinales bacterium]